MSEGEGGQEAGLRAPCTQLPLYLGSGPQGALELDVISVLHRERRERASVCGKEKRRENSEPLLMFDRQPEHFVPKPGKLAVKNKLLFKNIHHSKWLASLSSNNPIGRPFLPLKLLRCGKSIRKQKGGVGGALWRR